MNARLPAGSAGERGLEGPPLRPVHTFSIVARDAGTGEMGVAVQSHWFNVGSIVPWAEAGVGAVATQAFVHAGYGPEGLQWMKTRSAPDALRALLEKDGGRDLRQVAFVDARGRVAAHTGKKCIDYAGHQVGEGYSVQANMMLTNGVVPAMAEAYESSNGDLAERMVAALEAAQAEGGDIRGKQSAAVLVVKGEPTGRPWADRVVDLRVEDHPEPVRELRRLLTVHRAYVHMNQGDDALEKGETGRALEYYSKAAGLVTANPEMLYWHAVSLATNGRMEESIPLFKRVFRMDPNWRELTRRLHKPGIFPDTGEGRALVEKILRGTE